MCARQIGRKMRICDVAVDGGVARKGERGGGGKVRWCVTELAADRHAVSTDATDQISIIAVCAGGRPQ